MRRIGIISGILMFMTVSVWARTWYIKVDGSGDAPTIQAGIDSAVAGDTVLVASGNYTWTNQGTADSTALVRMKAGVFLKSDTGVPENTVIDAEGLGRVILGDSLVLDTWIAGFTIRNGFLDVGDSPEACGAGLRCIGSALHVENCIFSTNSAGRLGGGIYFSEGSPQAAGCSFLSNSAPMGGWHNGGGGVYCIKASPTLTDCRFSQNSAYLGGGLRCDSAMATLQGCEFTSNDAYDAGGASFYLHGTAELISCEFTGNFALRGGGGIGLSTHTDASCSLCTFQFNIADEYCGAISCWYRCTIDLVECILLENETNYSRGGGLAVNDTCFVSIRNCSLVGNTTPSSTQGSAVALRHDSDAVLYNSIISHGGPSVPVYCGDVSSIDLTCCNVYGNAGGNWVGCIEDQFGVDGNISADPLFCNKDDGDLHLDDMSPCAPAQQPICGLIGALGVGCYSGVDEVGTESPDRLSMTVLPNPIVSEASLQLNLPFGSHIKVSVYDISGGAVTSLADGYMKEGRHTFTWPHRNKGGNDAAPGIYFMRAQAGDHVAVSKVVLLK